MFGSLYLSSIFAAAIRALKTPLPFAIEGGLYSACEVYKSIAKTMGKGKQNISPPTDWVSPQDLCQFIICVKYPKNIFKFKKYLNPFFFFRADQLILKPSKRQSSIKSLALLLLTYSCRQIELFLGKKTKKTEAPVLRLVVH